MMFASSTTLLVLLLACAHLPLPAPALRVDYAALLEEARSPEVLGFMTRVRRQLHQFPELYFQEYNTSAFLRQTLAELGVEFKYPFATTGISAKIGVGDSPAIALRADIDGLPIEEPVEGTVAAREGFLSKAPGRMHACGHDAHMSMLLGAALMLKRREAQISSSSSAGGSKGGSVVLLFQPGEEAMGGAAHMIREGALRGARAVAGLHVWPALPAGTLATKPGTIMAASDRFAFSVIGRGGHGAMPHLAADPVVAAAAVILALQPLVSRETSPASGGAVVTVSRINTGPGASNVIPDSVALQGTVRALTEKDFDRLRRRVEQVAVQAAGAYGCNVSAVEWSTAPYPPTRNHPGMAQLALRVAQALASADASSRGSRSGGADASAASNQGEAAGAGLPPAVQVQELEEPSMAAEDFSFYGKQVPAVFSWLGIGDPALGTDASLHNPMFQVDERQMAVGAAMHVALALEALALDAQGPGPSGGDSSSSHGSGSGSGHQEL